MSKLPKFSYVREKLREVVTEDYRNLVKKLGDDIKNIVRYRQRRLVVLTGKDDIKLAGITAEIILRYYKRVKRVAKREKDTEIKVLYVYHDEFPDARLRAEIVKRVLKKNSNINLAVAVYEVSSRYLGTTFQVLIMDLVNDLKPNDVGRLMGIVEGGGLIIYVAPPISEWVRAKTIFRMNLTVPNHPEPRYVFTKWFIRKLMEHEGIYIFDADRGKLIKSGWSKKAFEKAKEFTRSIEIPKETVFDKELYELALTQDQVNVIKLIEKHLLPKVKKRRHVALVITADRGRGKSSAVGIGIVGLIKEFLKRKNKVRIAVTAKDPLSVQSLMDLACKAAKVLGLKYKIIRREDNIIEIKGDRFSIEYWQPYTVLRLNVDVVVVDEAAGIPVPLLHKIWLKYTRTIFATTIHGYEGAGRGFSIRFLKRLREDPKTELVMYEMREPIRYSIDDPIEKFQFDVLLLDAEPDALDEEDLKEIEEENFEYVRYDPEYLFSKKGEKELRSLFGIYVLAHYRNEPDDLARIADAPHHSIRALKLKKSGKIVAAVQLAEEGRIPDNLIDELLVGGKIPGNIIPDRLLKHLRVREFGRGIGWRIVRIAVHIDVQGKGIGSYLLKKIIEEAVERGYDWVGAGFGVSKELVNFWLKNGFSVLHISPDRNPVSGEYTALVIYPLSRKWRKLVELGNNEFSVKFIESLHAVYYDFEPDTAYTMIKRQLRNEEYASKIDLTPIQLERLKVYVSGIMTFESVCDAVSLLLKKYILMGLGSELSEEEGIVTVARVLQGWSWDKIFEEYRIGKVRATNMLRQIVSKMLERIYSIHVKPPET
ncbi:MAG: tRNA(Met) cytidine acetyltransferase [Desulfurococcales archaeon]|nr:tRNA(Met) cytidine acetyltransferase [Desulfurococcales archaeon]